VVTHDLKKGIIALVIKEGTGMQLISSMRITFPLLSWASRGRLLWDVLWPQVLIIVDDSAFEDACETLRANGFDDTGGLL
jgi:hypothetical protein